MFAIRTIVSSFSSIRRTLGVSLAALVVGAPLIAASPVFAGPKDPTVVVFGGGIQGYKSRDFHPAPACEPDREWASREYQRGASAGRNEGSSNGYRDGYAACRFDDCPKIDFCHLSRPFQGGYRSAYGCAYKEGFNSGREALRCERERQRERERQIAWQREHERWHDCDHDDHWFFNIHLNW